MNVIRNSSKVLMWVLVLMICFTGCKSKKKAAEAARAAEERARIEQEATLRKDEEQKRKEAEEAAAAQREAEARQRDLMANEPKAKLNQYFESIARSGNVASSNSSINEALGLFSSPDTPVLIVISEEGGQKDYDRPTTIREYLNYLKDTKNNSNSIGNLQFDNSGKITEVELRKN